MRWVDVCGLPGSGKSTLCDAEWPPREIPNDEAGMPESWGAFVECTERLVALTKHHPSHRACVSMTRRSFAKMATVSRLRSDRIYTQTGLAQRGLGISWRLRNPSLAEEYFRLMPISVGVAILTADIFTLRRRNVDRGKDRSALLVPMEGAMEVAKSSLISRGVPLLILDATQSIESNAGHLRDFSEEAARALVA